MRRYLPWLGLGLGLIALTLLFFSDVLFRDRQFAYRDAAHYYYPLYHRVQTEWNEGRWPLWEPEENSGMPLLGNPTAAVLYPGKILFAKIPYAWGARIYIIAHTLLAFVAMLVLMRQWEVSWTGSILAGLSYAFGMPVLFQYCNIIYLVGAAWTPLGFHAADRWLRLGNRWGLWELAAVLAMQVLGGEPQSAYILGICAAGYALALGWESRPKKKPSKPFTTKKWLILIGGLLVVWTVLVCLAAAFMPQFRKPGLPKPLLPWARYVPALVLLCWIGFTARLILVWKKGRARRLQSMLIGLILAGGLGGALTAVQLIPVYEFTSKTARAVEEGPHDIYPFAFEPIRVVEAFWPWVFGSNYKSTTHWFYAIPPSLGHAKEWTPSIYIGGLSILLGLAGLFISENTAWRRWLIVITVVSFLGALGEYAGPLWWVRCIPSFAKSIGVHDKFDSGVIRFDDQLRDGDGSFYWFLSSVLPGFGQFRYPAKLLTFTAFALAALSGVGWDQLIKGRGKVIRQMALAVLGVSLVVLLGVVIGRGPILGFFQAFSETGFRASFGPLNAEGAWWAIVQSLIHGSCCMIAVLVLIRLANKRPELACRFVVLIVVADLWIANRNCLVTVPQAMFEVTPKAIEIIREAEKKDPDPMPYRVHRMPSWEPPIWGTIASPNRLTDLMEWEHATIQPKYGLLFDVNYTFTLGVAELFDYDMLLASFERKVDEASARALNIKPGDEVVYHSRRGYDLWNSRYFIVPGYPGGWNNEHRGYASFMTNVERIYPPADIFRGADTEEKQKKWIQEEDMQIFRNKSVMPRAWVVHEAKYLAPIVGMGRLSRKELVEQMIYQGDALWYDSSRIVYDVRRTCWVEADATEKADLYNYLVGGPVDPTETVKFEIYQPQRVEMKVNMKRPGMVILADVNYPGWKLRIDGKPAPIRVVNRIMRGAAVLSGEHTLVYTFEPQSFYVGGIVTLVSLALWLGLGLYVWRNPVSKLLVPG